MSLAPVLDRLYELLPGVDRMRDAEQGYPLRALLRVICEQVDVVEQDIAQLYDNWFIETCDDWVVPYIGELIGYQPVNEAGVAQSARTPDGRAQNKVLTPRREVANTIDFRRRKGTLALLELLANDVAAWPARAVEFYTLLGWTQHLDHLRRARGGTVDLRSSETLDLIDGPFDCLAHTVDVRRPVSRRKPGRFNIPSAGVHIWRIRSYPVTHAPANCVKEIGRQCYTFSVLGNDAPLFTKYEPESSPTHIAEEINLPVPIRRRALENRLTVRPLKTEAAGALYGEGKSLAVYAPDWPAKDAPQPLPRNLVIPADLSQWRYRASRDQVAVDPVLGRIVFPSGQVPPRGVWLSYHYGFSADLGGGEYDRLLTQPDAYTLYRVSKDYTGDGILGSIGAALLKWRDDQHALGGAPAGSADAATKANWQAAAQRLRYAVIEIGDSAVYTEALAVALETGESLQIRAGNRRRPVIRLPDYMPEEHDAFTISGKLGSRFTLSGLLVAGRGLEINGAAAARATDGSGATDSDLCDVTIRHCTLVPGSGLDCGCEPTRAREPSVSVVNSSAKLVIDHSIVGSIQVYANEVMMDPVVIAIVDSIVDATSLERTALGAPDLSLAFARVSIVRSTVFGEFNTHAILLAENSIFAGPLMVGRRQQGCLRFCYVSPGSRTPRRYHCQPDLARSAVDERTPPLADDQRAVVKTCEGLRIRPRFRSMRYGTPDYCRLSDDCATEIVRGADDEAEMGVFHDLFQAQREANLRSRVDEYTPAGMNTGIIPAG